MACGFDPTDDFADVADFQQEVTLLRPGTSDAWPLSRAVRAAIRASEARASRGRLTEDDVVWHLDGAELEAAPRPGDVIVDIETGRWTVLAARHTVTGRWRCVCRDLAVAHGLDQYLDVEVAVRGKGAAGAETVSWHAWRTGIAARIQSVRTTVEDRHERTTSVGRFTIYVAESLPLDHTHRIKGPDATVYRVVGCRKPDRIEGVMEIEAVVEGLGTGD